MDLENQLSSALVLPCAGSSHPGMGCTVFYRSREEGIIFTEDLLWLCQTHPTSHLSVIRHTPHIYYALGMGIQCW